VNGTYVYCLVAAPRRPSMTRVPRGVPGLGRPRLIDVPATKNGAARSTWLVAADAPLDRFGEEAINRGLSDLDWVSRAAVAHEAVIEAFVAAPAVLPMKLFTIFTSDERARDHVRGDGSRIAALVKRVANHQEWGVRVMLDRAPAATSAPAATRAKKTSPSGRSFLMQKKAQRDLVTERAERAQESVAGLYDALAARAREAKRRAASELPVKGGPLLLDAAFLVPAAKAASFRSLVGRQARALERSGYRVSLTGPWPPYTFVQD